MPGSGSSRRPGALRGLALGALGLAAALALGACCSYRTGPAGTTVRRVPGLPSACCCGKVRDRGERQALPGGGWPQEPCGGAAGPPPPRGGPPIP